jgi:hypothetical protein
MEEGASLNAAWPAAISNFFGGAAQGNSRMEEKEGSPARLPYQTSLVGQHLITKETVEADVCIRLSQ